ncbi:MAG: TIGR02281 family clan AA aspartic protease [Hyphomicrobiaceae bacterium]|nr:TIGR02281 family clan AA aspartic protease [Hyphomicrobiaceae bacterium]
MASQVRNVGDSVELRSGRNGHFETAAEINGRDINVLVDTGATMVVLTYEDAERAGIYVNSGDFTVGSRTANGTARNAPVTLSKVCIDRICVRDVRAMVAEPGRLHVTLLGMTFLGRLSRVDMRSGTLVLAE